MLKTYLRKKKRLKRSLELETEAEKDIISGLPDAVLHQILCLLVTKEAVRTSILSKRWKFLWTSMPILDFSRDSFLPRRCDGGGTRDRIDRTRLFMNFLDNVLLNYQKKFPVAKFYLYCNSFFETSRLHTWLCCLLRHKIQHLELVLDKRHLHFLFPCSFFTCDSLTVIKLETRCDFKLPSSSTISFPRLHTLSLKCVTFSDNVEQLFSNFPVLEHLYIIRCKWVNINTIHISAPTLRTLFMAEKRFDFSGYHPKEIDLCDMPFLTQGGIELYSKDKSLDAFLTQGAIELYRKDKSVDVQQIAIKFLRQLSKVQVLEIGKYVGQVLFRDESFLPHLPTFHNVISLTLTWGYIWFSTRMLRNILQNMPKLENLYINRSKLKFEDDDYSTGISLPQCLLLTLKHIEVTEFEGFTAEMDTIEFFLKYARVLEEMIIRTYTGFGIRTQEMVTQLLEKTPICSPRGYIHVREESK